MKFPQLSIGARFRYRGEVWCKTSPVAATGPDGANHMIPRSASVEPVDSGPPTSRIPPRQQALADHHRLCTGLLREAAESGPQALASLQRRLDQAHAALVAALD